MSGNRGSKFHPSRISGMQKQLRARDYNKSHAARKSRPIQPIDLTKNNWSKQP